MQVHQDMASGLALSGQVDPSTDLAFFPSPDAGCVRVPLWAGIQSDGPETVVICHTILRQAPALPGWLLAPTTCILWNVRLTPVAMAKPYSAPNGAELFIPVPLFPIPEGWEIIASFSYATAAHQVRTRAVSRQVDAETFDWSHVGIPNLPPMLTTV